jgi:DNA-binding transcriptional regulator YiaG
MARHKSALVALRKLEMSYEQHRRALLRKAQDAMAATVQRLVGELAGIAEDFPAVVSEAVASLALSAPTAAAGNAAPAAMAHAAASANGHAGERFRAMGVKAHRGKLGLSQDQYGRLVGVSSLTIYQWESGKTKPREAQKAKWLAIRGLGKEEAIRRLGTAELKAAPAASAKAAASTKRKRGTFKQTAEEMILSLLKGGKTLTTSELGAAWDEAGRGGVAADTLSKMVKDKKLVRKPVKAGRGSEYTRA